MIKCVLLLASDGQRIVSLKKDRGPAHLIGKLTFPGGKIEPGENPFDAARREMKEETGLNLSNWTLLESVATFDDYFMYIMISHNDKVSQAKTQESEEVHVLDILDARENALTEPSKYSSDFLRLLDLVLEYETNPSLELA